MGCLAVIEVKFVEFDCGLYCDQVFSEDLITVHGIK